MSKRLNRIHRSMIQRCYNKKREDYERYGGRGITICKEWYTPGTHTGWRNFRDWALTHGYSDELTIDRIDNSKGYTPENCRWATYKTQANNRRNTRLLTYKGETKTLIKWCEELKIDYHRMEMRIYVLNWPVTKAFETPIRTFHKKLNAKAKEK